jgi:hypothetical protein
MSAAERAKRVPNSPPRRRRDFRVVQRGRAASAAGAERNSQPGVWNYLEFPHRLRRRNTRHYDIPALAFAGCSPRADVETASHTRVSA